MCGGKVGTPLKSPVVVGANEYLSSGIASAAPTNSPSAIVKTALTASPGVFAGGGAAICPSENPEQPSTNRIPNSNFSLRIVSPEIEGYLAPRKLVPNHCRRQFQFSHGQAITPHRKQ